MNAKALICDSDRSFRVEDVVLPEPEASAIVVRTLFSGVSVGTEFALVRGKLSWGPFPICTGYQGVGVVEHVGPEVGGFARGDMVYYRDNPRMAWPDGSPISAVFGTHCSAAVIDVPTTHGVALKPGGVADDAASLFVMPAVGLNGVDMSNPHFGDVALVYGCGPIGLGVVAACRHRGCVVVAVDIDQVRLQVARELGADHLIDSSQQDPAEELRKIAPEGADLVFESTGQPELIAPATALCKFKGKLVYMGNYGSAPFTWEFMPPHARHLTAYFPMNDGLAACRRAVLRNMETGALRWEKTITHRVDWQDSARFFGEIEKGAAPGLVSAVIRWS